MKVTERTIHADEELYYLQQDCLQTKIRYLLNSCQFFFLYYSCREGSSKVNGIDCCDSASQLEIHA